MLERCWWQLFLVFCCFLFLSLHLFLKFQPFIPARLAVIGMIAVPGLKILFLALVI